MLNTVDTRMNTESSSGFKIEANDQVRVTNGADNAHAGVSEVVDAS